MFQDDVAAAVERFGVKDVGLIWGLGMVPWNSPEDRDGFLDMVKQIYRAE